MGKGLLAIIALCLLVTGCAQPKVSRWEVLQNVNLMVRSSLDSQNHMNCTLTIAFADGDIIDIDVDPSLCIKAEQAQDDAINQQRQMQQMLQQFGQSGGSLSVR